MGSKYNAIQQFVDDVKMGLDVEFSYDGKNYGVIRTPDGIAVYEQCNLNTEKVFDTPQGALDGYMIGGRPLRSLITEIEILLH